MLPTSKIIFNRDKFKTDLHENKLCPVFSYFTAPTLADGEYLWQSNLIKPKSIVHILNASLINIKDGKITPVFEDNEIQELVVKTLTSFDNDELYDILYNYKNSYSNIKKIFSNKVIFNKSFNEELLYYIDEIKKINTSFISNLYLAILYYLADNIEDCKNYLKSCQDIIDDYSLFNYSDYLIYVNKLLLTELKTSNLRKIYIVKNTDNVLGTGKIKDIFYIKRTIAAIKLFTKQNIYPIEGNRFIIISKLNSYKPTLLILWGHGTLSKGYKILDGKNDDEKKEHLNNIDMESLLNTYSENEDILLLDYACSKGHFSKLKYSIPMTLFAGTGDHGMSDSPGYRYSLGFIKTYVSTQTIEDCHEIGMICLTMGSRQYVNDFVKLNVTKKN
ncbi:MAG TPA: hypothetical protein VFG10_09310 [Saprospiraceae bacterium]|nr:hypothetical protein [Saprospiraceae bacterium]